MTYYEGFLFEISMALHTVFQVRPKIRLRRIFRRSRILVSGTEIRYSPIANSRVN